MQSATRLKRSPDVIAAEALGNAVLLNVTTWTYVNFNETGSWLWNCLDEPRTFGWLSAAAEEKFAGAPGDIAQDIQDFLRDLSEKGIILTEAAD